MNIKLSINKLSANKAENLKTELNKMRILKFSADYLSLIILLSINTSKNWNTVKCVIKISSFFGIKKEEMRKAKRLLGNYLQT